MLFNTKIDHVTARPMRFKPVSTTLVSLLFALLSCTAVFAETCKYVDMEGHVTYSDVPISNARKLGCIEAPPPVVAPTEPPKPSQVTPQVGSESPDASRPKTSDDRRKALVEELAREQDALAKA